MKLKINNLEFSYKSSKILQDITFEAKKGEIVSISGKNGAGKSTLLKNIAKILKPLKGTVYLNEKNLNKLKINEFAKTIGYVSQKNDITDLNTYDYLMLGRKPYFKFFPKKEDIDKVNEIIEKLNLNELKNKQINEISGGEFQKIAIARAIVQESKILLLDEPTNNLDLKNQLEILNFIKKITKEKELITIIIIHDINLSLKYSDKLIFMKNGIIKYQCKKNEINKNILKDIYEINLNIFFYNNTPVIIC
ncbi:ABC transporter ATP-binding protein [Lebetimonas sp. JH292]|uniref:ABC transporter ATP-binding protein n=1 Tax=Lebetimonas sp. JH292 TaxID=990068 RepID=UPI000464E5DD|nr:ABC transporter ATP-binding protein [Lebetimonas sp. JH292]